MAASKPASGGGSFAVPIFVITAGFTLVYSALKGIGLTEIFAGVTGDALNPKGVSRSAGGGGGADTADAGTATGGATATGDVGSFKGAHAADLRAIEKVAHSNFHLTTTNTCRTPAENARVGGSPTSDHVKCAAMDEAGSVQNRVAFARWAKKNYPQAQVFCDQAGMFAPGYDHSDHTHVGWS